MGQLMADHRQFCGECGMEVGFGQHKMDCGAPARERDLMRQHELNQQERLKEKKWRYDNSIAVYELMCSLKNILKPEDWQLLARYYELENNAPQSSVN